MKPARRGLASIIIIALIREGYDPHRGEEGTFCEAAVKRTKSSMSDIDRRHASEVPVVGFSTRPTHCQASMIRRLGLDGDF